ncbi:MAG TPA: ribonuclease HI [Thermoflexales bacterium]|nr:ribonuclease HI [Thermoflexales bacterium]
MKKVVMYTDGACDPNPGTGGWAAILMHGPHKKELSGRQPDTTNNRMELTAVIEGLRVLKEPCEVAIFTDSEYLRNGITTWLAGWKRKGWQTASKTPVKNQDLWQELDALTAQHTLSWEWVRGHADDPLNQRADYLARTARKH